MEIENQGAASVIEYLLPHLRDAVGDKQFTFPGGICEYIEHLIMAAPFCQTSHEIDREAHNLQTKMKSEIFVSWPSFSGDAYFPVSHVSWSSEYAYWFNESNTDERAKRLWHPRSAYGKSRRNLLRFVIDAFEKSLREFRTRTLDTHVARTLLNYLRNIEVNPAERDGLCGICKSYLLANSHLIEPYYIYGAIRRMQSILVRIFAKWPKSSGDIRFPVPDPEGIYTGCKMFHSENPKWDANTAYGSLRHELLAFVVEQLEADYEVAQ